MLRRYVIKRRPWFGWLRESLTKAGMTTTYDRYLVRGLRYAGVPATVGVVAGVALTYTAYAWLGVAAVVTGVLFGGSVLAGFLVYPAIRAKRRAREIDAELPYALMVTHILSKSGMSFLKVIEVLAESEDVYSELSLEFRRIRRDVTHYGDDVLTALESGRERTPSDDFAEFLDDTSTVLRSSTDFARFTESQYRKRYRSMRQGQEEFLQRLASFAQVYIVLVFVAPALVLVLLVLLSFSGADTLPAVYVTAYVYPVVGVGLSVAALNALERQVDPPKGKPKDDEEDAEPPPDSPEYARYRRTKLRRRVLRLRPSMVRRNPLATVLLTVPVAAVALNAFFDVVGSGPAGFYSQNPVEGTSVFVAVAVFVGAPVAVLYELRRREENRFVDRIPDTYERLAEAVSVGMTPSDACRVVSETVDGKMGDVLRRIHDETSLVGDVATAFVSATERIRVPEFTVTAKTAAETLRATNDAEAALRSLAQDASARAEIRSERRGSMELYGAVVVLGLLTYVATAILLELFFLPRLTGISEAAETGFLAPPSATPDDYRTVLFHASLIQGGLNGLFIGKLRSGDIREGLVYSVVFVVAITAVFLGI